MKALFPVFFGVCSLALGAVPGLDTPESVYVDPANGTVHVSNIAGSPVEKDGKGWIAKLTRNTRVTAEAWVQGLNAPKGMRSHDGVLWVTDIDEVVAIDQAHGRITAKIPVDGARFLNDVAVDTDGTVYVSDMLTSKIHTIKNGKASVFVEGNDLESPNGLLVHDGKLYVASWGTIKDRSTFAASPGLLYSLDLKTKERANVTTKPLGNLDGLERTAEGDFLVSDWVASKVYVVKPDGKTRILVQGQKNAADIGLDVKNQTLYVPWMSDNSVTIHPLKIERTPQR